MVVLNLCKAYGVAYVSSHVVNIIYVFVHYVLISVSSGVLYVEPADRNK